MKTSNNNIPDVQPLYKETFSGSTIEKNTSNFKIYKLFKRTLIVIVIISLFVLVFLQTKIFLMNIQTQKNSDAIEVSLRRQEELRSQIEKTLHFAALNKDNSEIVDGIIIIQDVDNN